MNHVPGTLRAWVTAFAAAATLSCALVCVASAGAESGLLGGCNQTLGQPFLPWLDPMSYTLAPNGGFEQGATGWQLAGGAATGSGNEPWLASGPGQSVLALPAGSSAVSSPVCIGLLDPTVRMFARNAAPLGLGSLAVSADITTGTSTVTLPVGVVVAGSTWQPTLPLPLLVNALSPLGAGTATARLHFTAVGGSWQLDDVYVDPFKTS
jgi:hypothetical protein